MNTTSSQKHLQFVSDCSLNLEYILYVDGMYTVYLEYILYVEGMYLVNFEYILCVDGMFTDTHTKRTDKIAQPLTCP